MGRINHVGLAARRHTVTLDIWGDPLTVTYRPYKIEERKRMVDSAVDDGDGGDMAAARFLSSVLIRWDMTESEEDNTPYPTDAESLYQLPAEFIGEVLKQIGESQRQGKRSSED